MRIRHTITVFLFLAFPAGLAAGTDAAAWKQPIVRDQSFENIPEYVIRLKEFIRRGETGESAVKKYLYDNNLSATRLHVALLKQNNYELKSLLYSYHSPDAPDSHGLTPLHYAALAGNDEAAALLLEFGASIDVLNVDTISAYDMAAFAGSLSLVTLFNEWLGDTIPRETAFDYAVRSGNVDLVAFLYDRKIVSRNENVRFLPSLPVCEFLIKNKLTGAGEISPLYYAVINKSKDHIFAFTQNSQFIKAGSCSPLAAAAAVNDFETVRLLVEKNADMYGRCYGKTALYYAAANGNAEMVLFLLKSGANPNTDDSPVSAALSSGSGSVFELLSENGAKIAYSKKVNLLCEAAKGGNVDLFSKMTRLGYSLYDRDSDGNSPLHCAAVNGCTEIVKLILSKKVPVALVNRSGDTALHLAAYYGKSGVARVLLQTRDAKKLITMKNRSGETALLSAVSGRSDEKTIQLLMQYGFKRNEVNKAKQNIFHIAVRKNPQIIPFLFKYSRELNVTDAAGETPLIYAIKYDQTKRYDTVDLLLKYGERIGFTSREKMHEWELALNGARDAKNTRYFPVRLLVKLGAPVNARDHEGRTLLARAVMNARYDDIEFLLSHNANTELTDSSSLSALSYAVMSDDEYAMKLVFESRFGRRIERNDEFNWIIRESRSKSVTYDDIFPAVKRGTFLMPAQCFYSAKIPAYFYAIERGLFSESLFTQKNKRVYSLSLIKAISLKGFNVDTKFADGATLLMKFSNDGDFAAVKNLVSMKADVNAKDKNGWTALIYALTSGKSSVARLLVENGADVNAMTRDGINPLLAAYASGDRRLSEIIEGKGGSIADCTVSVETVRFMTALEKPGSTKSIYRVDVQYRDTIGRTPLLKAAEKGSADTVKFLIDAGADINAKSNTGDTLLLYAIYSGNRSVINNAVKCGADPNEKNNAGTTPLQAAVNAKMYDVLPQLINCGGDPGARDADGKTLLHIIINDKSYPTSLVGYLIEKGVNPDQSSYSGCTPLMSAAQGGNYRSASLLLSSGAGLGCKDNKGKKAIDYAVESRSTEIIRLFFEHGEKPTAAAYAVLGDESLDQNRYSDAARYYRKALAADFSINVYNNLGRAHLKMQDFSTAEKCFRVAIKLKPEDPVGYFNMACYYSQLNCVSDAIDWLSTAINKGYSNYNNLYTDNSLVKIRNTDAFNRLMIKKQKN